MEWIFDPLAPSGSRLGGVPQAWVFDPELDIFVREVLQNSRDQRIKSSKLPARVKFSLIELSGPRKNSFLKGLDWQSLKPHLEGVAKTRTSMAKPISGSLKRFSKKPLLILRISDFGTIGLTGGEDEELTNFTSLCKNVLSTSEDEGNRVRGGSYGLGKAVLWRFSSISTVLFSSNLNQGKENRLRLFARSELCSHAVGGDNFQGYGWFGDVAAGYQGHGKRAVSSWDEKAAPVAADLLLARDPSLGSGTSIVVVGFKLPAFDEDPSTVEMGEEIAKSAARWFWPSLLRADPTLEVDVEAIDESGDVIFSTSVSETAEVRPFVHAYFGAATSEKAVKIDQIAERRIELSIPENLAESEPADEAEAIVKVCRTGAAFKSHQFAQHVALVRGSEMVVKYTRPSGIITDDFPFFAAVRVGHAKTLGAQVSEADDKAERFLRAAEPPSHNEWKLTSRVGEEYARGGGKKISTFLKDVAMAVRELCEPNITEAKAGPDLLARLFPIGETGSSSGMREYTVTGLRANFKGGQWKFAGRVKRKPVKRGIKKTPWNVTVKLFQNSESGRPGPEDMIDIKTFDATHGELVEQSGSVSWFIPAKHSDIVFKGTTAKFNKESELADLRRTSVTVQVIPITQPEES